MSGPGTIFLIDSETGGVFDFAVDFGLNPEDMNAFISPLEFTET